MGKGRGGRGFGGHKSHGFGGHKSHGFGGHRSHGIGGHHHHHHYGGGRGARNMGATFQASMDLLHNSTVPPTLINGVYSFVGSEMSFRAHAEQPINQLQPQNMQQMQQQGLNMYMPNNGDMPYQQMNTFMQTNPLGDPFMQMTPPQIQSTNIPVQQININLVGNKTKPGSNGCFVATMLTGAFCIFPLCFMCCMWWKKIVYPMYELSPQAYRDIGSFIERNPTANNLNLTVVDNAFNAEKARILYESLSRSRITALTFVNGALECNGQFNEADDFRNNVLPIKSLSLTSSLTWGEMIL